MKIIVDAMGGDYAPEETVHGSVLAAKEFGVEIVLVGDEEKLRQELAKYNEKELPITVIHAPEVIAMDEHPAVAVRKKKNSSIVMATQLVKEGHGNAVVSAGSTGAAMAAALLGFGRIKGIQRPAIGSIMPTINGRVLLLDAGANADCTPDNLSQFALMGNIYAHKVMGLTNPRVGLLSIGEEETKGNELTLAAHEILKGAKYNFIGNIEGRDIFHGITDVVVCDGFVGNVVLKTAEGLASDLMTMIKDEIKKSILSTVGAALILPGMKELRRRLDPAEYGGAPLLGVNGISIISHGSSKAKAIKSAIRVAKDCVAQDLVANIKDSLQVNATIGVD